MRIPVSGPIIRSKTPWSAAPVTTPWSAAVTPFAAGAPSHVLTRSLVAVCLLGALGTGLAYVLQFVVLRAVGTTTASTVTYVIPIVSTIAGIVLLDEHLRWNEPVGGLLVIIGAAIAQGIITWNPAKSNTSRLREPAAMRNDDV